MSGLLGMLAHPASAIVGGYAPAANEYRFDAVAALGKTANLCGPIAYNNNNNTGSAVLIDCEWALTAWHNLSWGSHSYLDDNFTNTYRQQDTLRSGFDETRMVLLARSTINRRFSDPIRFMTSRLWSTSFQRNNTVLRQLPCGKVELVGAILGGLAANLWDFQDIPAFPIPFYDDPCPADLNDAEVVDGGDLGVLLLEWGTSGCVGSGLPCAADLDCNGTVDGSDLAGR
jgi:hypothetical protein